MVLEATLFCLAAPPPPAPTAAAGEGASHAWEAIDLTGSSPTNTTNVHSPPFTALAHRITRSLPLAAHRRASARLRCIFMCMSRPRMRKSVLWEELLSRCSPVRCPLARRQRCLAVQAHGHAAAPAAELHCLRLPQSTRRQLPRGPGGAMENMLLHTVQLDDQPMVRTPTSRCATPARGSRLTLALPPAGRRHTPHPEPARFRRHRRPPAAAQLRQASQGAAAQGQGAGAPRQALAAAAPPPPPSCAAARPWQRRSPAPCPPMQAHGTSCRAVRFGGGGDLLYTGSTGGRGGLAAVGAAGGRCQARAPAPAPAHLLIGPALLPALHPRLSPPDESILAVDVATGKAQARKKAAHNCAINRLATTGPMGLASGARRRVRGGAQQDVQLAGHGPPGAARCCLPAPTSCPPACLDLAAGDDEGVVKLWDSRQSEAVATLEAHSGAPACAAGACCAACCATCCAAYAACSSTIPLPSLCCPSSRQTMWRTCVCCPTSTACCPWRATARWR